MAYTRYRLPVLFPLSSLVLSLSLFLPFFSSPSYHSIFGLMGRRLLGNFAYRVLQAIIWASTPKSSFFQTLNDGQLISRRETVDVTNRETSFHKHSLFFSLFPLHTKRGFSPLFFFSSVDFFKITRFCEIRKFRFFKKISHDEVEIEIIQNAIIP